MQNNWKITLIGWAGFIIMLVLFLQRCGAGGGTKTVATHDTINTHTYDSVEKIVRIKVKLPADSFIVKIPANIDTAQILQRYFNEYYYSQKIVSDTNMVATITDTLSQNRITGMGFTYKWLKPITNTTIVNNTTTVLQPKRALYIGAFIQANTTGTQLGCGPQIQFATKKNTLYNAGYDFLQKQIRLGASIKLGKRASN